MILATMLRAMRADAGETRIAAGVSLHPARGDNASDLAKLDAGAALGPTPTSIDSDIAEFGATGIDGRGASSAPLVGATGKSRRKRVFFLHVSKAGGSKINSLARKNGEVQENIGWIGSKCPTLSQCSADVTFAQWENALGSLSPEDLELLFPPRKTESRWLKVLQLRKAEDLVASWFFEQKYGYKVREMAATSFAEYIQPGWSLSSLKRGMMHPILVNLGSDQKRAQLEDFRRPPEVLAAWEQNAIAFLNRFDVITMLEQ
eukprot:CAMPEP_0117577518 /NCGR_PEP_ID=MMETSP0784-20121206/63465_1 /TAXON_ID=39447 /ORGANISM="" /LENGTH=260 /DNA_ID=CAMNT_0005377025 /DNA_START=52 /DNA_END=831 /DNA_ORIENTATION=-